MRVETIVDNPDPTAGKQYGDGGIETVTTRISSATPADPAADFAADRLNTPNLAASSKAQSASLA